MKNQCIQRGLIAVLILSNAGCGFSIRAFRQLLAPAGRNANLVPEFSPLDTSGSTNLPSFKASGLQTNDQVIVFRGADSNCSGGVVVGQSTVPSNSASVDIVTTNPGMSIPDPNSQFRMRVTHADGSSVCTAPNPFNLKVLKAIQISANGGDHSCALLSDQTIRCWGSNNYGELGNGTTSGTGSAVVQVAAISDAIQVAAGVSYSCALHSNGTISCWGYNGGGQLGDGTTTSSSVPVSVVGVTNAIQVSAGSFHACAVIIDGSISCWGYNGYGQFGNGTTSSTPSTAVPVTGILTATQVAVGTNLTCARLSDGSASCWGYNGYGQLGDGTTTSRSLPVVVNGILTATQVSVGYGGYACALLSNGKVSCWGYNGFGQLGNNMTTNSSVPVLVNGISNATQIALGGNHSCAVLADGTSSCWGYNSYGQLGNGTNLNSSVPVSVTGLTQAVQIVSGQSHSCVLLSGGGMTCWGYNLYGQLGHLRQFSTTPLMVSKLTNVAHVSSGGASNCALFSDGKVACWGDNTYGQLGIGTTTPSSNPITIAGLSQVVQISTAGASNCAVLSNGTVSCWGYNLFGQVGDGTMTNALSPAAVSGITNAVQVAAGYLHTCAVLADGKIKCWGANSTGQLGDGYAEGQSNSPVLVTGITNAVSMSSGQQSSCAVLADKTVWCWGDNGGGQLGNGTATSSGVPVQVVGITNAVQVSVGMVYSCAVLTDHSVKCWGDNTYGQLGDGGSTSSLTPVSVSGVSNVKSIAAGALHSCATQADGKVICWGVNMAGQIGNGSQVMAGVAATAVLTIDNAIESAAANGGLDSCALFQTGTVACWGYNVNGNLGQDLPALSFITEL